MASKSYRYAVTDEEIEQAIEKKEGRDPGDYYEEIMLQKDPVTGEILDLIRKKNSIIHDPSNTEEKEWLENPHYGIEIIRYYLSEDTWIDSCFIKREGVGSAVWYYAYMKTKTPLPDRTPTAHRILATLHKCFPEHAQLVPYDLKALCETADVRSIDNAPKCLQMPDYNSEDGVVYIDMPHFYNTDDEIE